MAACLYLLREPVTGIESSLFTSQESGYVLLEEGLPASSTSFAEHVRKDGRNDSLTSVKVADQDLLDLVFAHTKVILL
ncbi:MAG: hypothetical protein Q8N04_18375 [Nitrospira sp.]|nr:hypothetical protein [Nitrospira sp.]